MFYYGDNILKIQSESIFFQGDMLPEFILKTQLKETVRNVLATQQIWPILF